MNKKVTAAQLERLFDFTRQHFVEYHDLQAELADHLANAIEEQWKENPDIDFEQALQLEFKKFGIFGFADVIEKRQAALTRKYRLLLWSYFKVYFKLPNILGVIAVIYIVFKLLEFSQLFYIGLLGFEIIWTTSRVRDLNKKYKTKLKQTGKRWLLEEFIYRCGGIGPLLCVPLQMAQFIFEESVPSYILLTISILFVSAVIYDYVVLAIMPSRAEEHLSTTYPEYEINN